METAIETTPMLEPRYSAGARDTIMPTMQGYAKAMETHVAMRNIRKPPMPELHAAYACHHDGEPRWVQVGPGVSGTKGIFQGARVLRARFTAQHVPL